MDYNIYPAGLVRIWGGANIPKDESSNFRIVFKLKECFEELQLK